MTTLPGLSLSDAPYEPVSSTSTVTRTQEIPAGSEYRFEVDFDQRLKIKLISGTAELFGTELSPGSKDAYEFSGTKAAIYTWHGCKLELEGEVDSEYVAEETQMSSYLNAHFALETVREKVEPTNQTGPRVLVVGPENAGKTTLVKILTAYAIKMGRQPTVVNLDPRQGMLSVPGSFTAAAFSSLLDVEEGWGSSPISGPSPVPVKMPLVYHYGMATSEEGKLFPPLVTRMALAVTSRLEADKKCKTAGFIIDTPGSLSHGKVHNGANIVHGRGGVYENIAHIVSEFQVNVIFVLGSERLYSDLSRKYANSTDEAIAVVRLDKSGGCVDRDDEYMKQLRQRQIRSYFFGYGEHALSPSTHWEDYSGLNIYKIVDPSGPGAGLFRSGDADDDDIYSSRHGSNATGLYEKVTPGPMLQNRLLAVTTASANSSHETIRDSSVIGYLYVVDVDETRKKLRILTPQSGRIPAKAIIMGSFPEDVPGLVS